MQSGVCTLLGVLIALSVTGSSIGLQCYYCIGSVDDCGDPFNTTTAVTMTCQADGSTCAVAKRIDNGVTQIFRTCTPVNVTGIGVVQCTPGCFPPPIDTCAECCMEDRCNGGPVPTNGGPEPTQPTPDPEQPPQSSPSPIGKGATLAPNLKSALSLMAALAMYLAL
ncbi:uncharacterized protein LOC119725624 [Patiria miniata]|uniref:Uncharacterized protein n=1 Tax=Patiria miniata TaxID=46514 RepID=A0A913ZMR1_PATMI|nr:uncharacterized protein LOC119725624 [Patiria miniata]XP_038053031.1 uncharacterized protein LOC119725624 [Patiria miniata]XP_038053032.1 uncharacterized protein LOC119725624 [Patiria miniata]